jgi:histidine triad (HIT) family protein
MATHPRLMVIFSHMENCLFCKIASGMIPAEKIYEDDHTFAFLDIKPLNEGHALVVPKAHHTDTLTVPKETYLRVMETVHKLAPVIKEVTHAEGVNIHSNNGAAAGQVVFHLHIHIIPRVSGDGYTHWHRENLPVALKETQARILEALRK